MPVTLHVRPLLRPQTFARMTPERLIRQEADRVAVELQALWREVFSDVQTHISRAALREVLRTGRLFEVEAFLAPLWERYAEQPTRRVLPEVLLTTIQQTADALSRGLAATLGAAAVEIELSASLPWLLTYTGSQIVAISDTTRQAIRQLVREAFTVGTSPDALAQRIKTQIGLTPHQMETVERLRQHLMDVGTPGREIARQVKNASQKALARRAEVIARQESMSAANQGQQELWKQAERQGLLRSAEWQRKWLTAPDERTCPICRPMNGQRRGLDEAFQTPTGGSVLVPPAHIQCRCVTTLVPTSREEAA